MEWPREKLVKLAGITGLPVGQNCVGTTGFSIIINQNCLQKFISS